MAVHKMDAILSMVDKAKEGWDGDKDFTEYMREDFIPSLEKPKEKRGAIQRYQSYFNVGGPNV